jgi:hypothetical protein
MESPAFGAWNSFFSGFCIAQRNPSVIIFPFAVPLALPGMSAPMRHTFANGLRHFVGAAGSRDNAKPKAAALWLTAEQAL